MVYLVIRGSGWKLNCENVCLQVSWMAVFFCLFRRNINPNIASVGLWKQDVNWVSLALKKLDKICSHFSPYIESSELSLQISEVPRGAMYFESATLIWGLCLLPDFGLWIFPSSYCIVTLVSPCGEQNPPFLEWCIHSHTLHSENSCRNSIGVWKVVQLWNRAYRGSGSCSKLSSWQMELGLPPGLFLSSWYYLFPCLRLYVSCWFRHRPTNYVPQAKLACHLFL